MLGSSMEKPKGLATRCSSLYCSYVHDGQKLYRTKQMNTRKRRKKLQNQPVFSTTRQFPGAFERDPVHGISGFGTTWMKSLQTKHSHSHVFSFS